MGKGQSKPHTVSFDNESPGIIDISEDVVSRLKRDMVKGEKCNFVCNWLNNILLIFLFSRFTLRYTTIGDNFRPLHIVEREAKRAEARELQQQQPAAPAPLIQQAPTIVYQGSPTITSLEVRKQKEAELFANDQYWANRLKNQEAEFLKNSRIMEKEFNDTVSAQVKQPKREALTLTPF